MQRAIAKEAEAIREKRARIIRAEGEQEAARKLSEAADMIAAAPGALELRRLQTLTEIGVEHNSTIIAMLPVELVHAARKIAGMPPATLKRGLNPNGRKRVERRTGRTHDARFRTAAGRTHCPRARRRGAQQQCRRQRPVGGRRRSTWPGASM